MLKISLSSDELVGRLLSLDPRFGLCLLDSCGIDHFGSHLMIAGIFPISCETSNGSDANEIVSAFSDLLSITSNACIFTLSYELGLLINNLESNHMSEEPKVFVSQFSNLIIHDYETKESYITGDVERFAEIESLLIKTERIDFHSQNIAEFNVSSNYSKDEYIETVQKIKHSIIAGDTYQTNLTQKVDVYCSETLNPENIFWNLKKKNPAPFSAFLRRENDVVISASPERFLKIENGEIFASPIKGTRRRGNSAKEDETLRQDLLISEKDRAENIMIVDLLRNDIGRVCEYGSVQVLELCKLYEHPTLFHLVSTIKGRLSVGTGYDDILNAVFPCGSITGAPKISTMKIIDETETAARGLSMGAIGFYIPEDRFGMPQTFDMSVAIRTITIKDNLATFNVGGGITIDSDPTEEYEESLLKAKALLAAIHKDIKIG